MRIFWLPADCSSKNAQGKVPSEQTTTWNQLTLDN
jgi:hypothetical protein